MWSIRKVSEFESRVDMQYIGKTRGLFYTKPMTGATYIHIHIKNVRVKLIQNIQHIHMYGSSQYVGGKGEMVAKYNAELFRGRWMEDIYNYIYIRTLIIFSFVILGFQLH